MIIIYEDNGGRLCNKLHLFSHFIAFALEHHISIAYKDFSPFSHLFESTIENNSFFCSNRNIILKYTYPYISEFILNMNKSVSLRKRDSLVKNIYATRKIDFIDLASFNNSKVFLSSFFVYTYGYFFRYYEGIRQHGKKIRDFFKPTKEFCAIAENYIKRIDKNRYHIIGVHIRHTDYVTWQGGRHFFTIKQYKGIMESVRLLFKNEKNVFFIISSDADLKEEDFSGFEFLILREEPIVCLHALSLCDYLIGPKSSFNRWASFYGNIPLYTIYDADKPLNKSDFQVNYLDDSHAIFNEPD